ncbi:PepSY-like domain-containing protein [Methylobacter svalbardensis]|uniref:PepSY-like domain-containing protein n=1 Tax=Methylobacter svalbardensis TaxID=3080016 RepID=UPI0030ED3CDE
MYKKLLITTFVTLTFSAAVYAEETREITFEKLPEVVQSSALKHQVRSSITKVEAIQDKGITKYEIESKNDGISKDITFAANGLVMEIEQGMQFAQLPLAAQNAIKKGYPEIKITEVESIQEFFFDVEGDVKGKSVEVKVLASGDIKDNDASDNKD